MTAFSSHGLTACHAAVTNGDVTAVNIKRLTLSRLQRM